MSQPRVATLVLKRSQKFKPKVEPWEEEKEEEKMIN